MRRGSLLVGVIRAVGFAMFLTAASAHAVCDGLKAYSQTPASNNAAAPCGWIGGTMLPNQVPSVGQQNMADLRAWYDDAQWINPGYPVRYISGTAFEVSASNPSIYHLSRRVKVDNGSTGLTYGTIVSVTDHPSMTALGGSRTVIVTPDSGSISNSMANVWYGAVGAISSSIVSATLGLDVLGTPFQLTSGTTKVVAHAYGVSESVNGVQMTSLTSAGLAVSGTVSATGVGVFAGVSATGVVSAVGVNSIGDITATARTVTANLLSATTVSGSLVRAGSVTIAGLPLLLPVASGVISYNGSGCTVTKNRLNIASCTRVNTGDYGVSLSITLADTNYQPVCSVRGNGNTLWLPSVPGSVSATTTGFRVSTLAFTGGTPTSADPNVIDCTVYQ